MSQHENGKSRSTYLSKSERLRFDAMARFDSIKAAALSLGLTPQTLYNWRLEIRKRYRRRRGWINAVLAQTKRGSSLTDLLHEKRKMKPPDDFEEEEE